MKYFEDEAARLIEERNSKPRVCSLTHVHGRRLTTDLYSSHARYSSHDCMTRHYTPYTSHARSPESVHNCTLVIYHAQQTFLLALPIRRQRHEQHKISCSEGLLKNAPSLAPTQLDEQAENYKYVVLNTWRYKMGLTLRARQQ